MSLLFTLYNICIWFTFNLILLPSLHHVQTFRKYDCKIMDFWHQNIFTDFRHFYTKKWRTYVKYYINNGAWNSDFIPYFSVNMHNGCQIFTKSFVQYAQRICWNTVENSKISVTFQHFPQSFQHTAVKWLDFSSICTKVVDFFVHTLYSGVVK